MEHTNILFPFNERIKSNKVIPILFLFLVILLIKILPLSLQNYEYIYVIPLEETDKVILKSVLPLEQTEKMLKAEKIVCDNKDYSVKEVNITPFIDETSGQGYNNIEFAIEKNDCFKSSVMQKVKVLKEKQSIKERIKRLLN